MVSINAASCPGCGRTLNEQPVFLKTLKVIGSVFLILVFFYFLFALVGGCLYIASQH